MTKKYIFKHNKNILFSLIIFVLVGCSNNPQKPDSSYKEDGSPKLPKVLTELEDEVLKIMYDIDSITGIEKAIEEMNSAAKATEEMNGAAEATSSEKTENNQEKPEKTSESEKEESKQKEKVDLQELIKENKIIIPLLDAVEVKGSFVESTSPITDINQAWTKINDNVIEVHKKWNVLEAQLTSINVPNTKLEEFEKTLDDLTTSIMNKEKLPSLKLSNEITRITADFRSYFNGAADHGVYGMYYHIRGAILFASSDNYSGALQHLDEASRLGSSLRQNLIKQGSQDILQKFELSVEDLKKQLIDQNFYLSQIKAPIVIKNIKLIQDKFETQRK